MPWPTSRRPSRPAASISGRSAAAAWGPTAHLIFKTSDDATTSEVLTAGGYDFHEGEALLVEVDDRPGGMARVARALADAGVNIYGHLFIGRWGDQAQFSFVVDDLGRAKAALEGISSVHAG